MGRPSGTYDAETTRTLRYVQRLLSIASSTAPDQNLKLRDAINLVAHADFTGMKDRECTPQELLKAISRGRFFIPLEVAEKLDAEAEAVANRKYPKPRSPSSRARKERLRRKAYREAPVAKTAAAAHLTSAFERLEGAYYNRGRDLPPLPPFATADDLYSAFVAAFGIEPERPWTIG